MKTRFQDYLSRLFRSPMVEKFQTPARRRGVAVCLLAVQLAAAASFTLIPHGIYWPLVPALIAMVYLQGMLNMSTRGMFELADRHLDELLAGERDAAYRKSYFFPLVWLVLIPIVDAIFENVAHGRVYLLAFVMLGFFWGLSLPRIVAAWPRTAETEEA